MNDNLAIVLVMALSIAAAVALTMLKINAKVRIAAAAGGAAVQPRVEQLTGENAALRGEVGQLHARIAVLERIATDPGERTAREIESLR